MGEVYSVTNTACLVLTSTQPSALWSARGQMTMVYDRTRRARTDLLLAIDATRIRLKDEELLACQTNTATLDGCSVVESGDDCLLLFRRQLYGARHIVILVNRSADQAYCVTRRGCPYTASKADDGSL